MKQENEYYYCIDTIVTRHSPQPGLLYSIGTLSLGMSGLIARELFPILSLTLLSEMSIFWA